MQSARRFSVGESDVEEGSPMSTDEEQDLKAILQSLYF